MGRSAQRHCRKEYASRRPLLFHNAKFDLAVSEAHMDLPPPSWDRVHDTLFLLYLNNPRQKTFSLKPSAELLLGWEPEERDAVEDWLVENQPIPGVRITRGFGKNGAGKYIAYAPAELVGAYANGDTDRTEGLFTHLWESIQLRGMNDAYNRERQVLMILLDMEKQGVPVDYTRLERDVEQYNGVRDKLTDWVQKRLKQPSDFNLDSDAQLLQALLDSGKVDEGKLLRTDKDNLSASKASLAGAMNDRVLQEVLAYRSELSTCLGTFMENYLYTARQSGGYIYTDWNQCRQDRSGAKGIVGTSTGRLSSTPNFQNISNQFPPHFKHLAQARGYEKSDVRALPKAPFDLPELPLVRSYIVPYDGEVLVDRDYSQQELRILGHYAGGSLAEAYAENPWLDIHSWARDEINAMLRAGFERRPIKDIGFGLIYGMGLGLLAIKAGTDVKTAKQLKGAYLEVAPGLKELYADMKQRRKDHEPIYTWGGREYYCEEGKMVNGRFMEFDYKMVNILIQGSAAECTKQAFINYYARKPPEHRLLLTVHDQLTGSVPRRDLADAQECMREAMEDVDFDVPMLSEGDYSFENWAKTSLKPYDRGGKILYTAGT